MQTVFPAENRWPQKKKNCQLAIFRNFLQAFKPNQ